MPLEQFWEIIYSSENPHKHKLHSALVFPRKNQDSARPALSLPGDSEWSFQIALWDMETHLKPTWDNLN